MDNCYVCNKPVETTMNYIYKRILTKDLVIKHLFFHPGCYETSIDKMLIAPDRSKL